jgi:acyl-coenzyme A synthetase/AMP-(fatty) acid ligase
MLAQLKAAYPDLYILCDAHGEADGIETFSYPDALPHSETISIPAFPSDQPAIVLFTSGSTGAPQPQPRCWGALVASTLAAGKRLLTPALQGATLVATVPHQHSYGIESTVMLGLQHGLALDCGRPLLPADVVARLGTVPRPIILVTTPIHLNALAAESADLPPIDLVLSATAPLGQDLAQEIEQRFAAPLREIYGCSEAGQLATRETACETAWTCLDGITLRQDGPHTYAAGEPVGREQILADIIELESPTRFTLRGRLADMVNIAGKRSSLVALNHQLMAVPGVQDGTFLIPDGDDCLRLMAFAVAPGLASTTIISHLRQHIDPAFLPRPLILLDSLPRNPLGKLPREALLALAEKAKP